MSRNVRSPATVQLVGVSALGDNGLAAAAVTLPAGLLFTAEATSVSGGGGKKSFISGSPT
jgi:hypothetical protein